MCTLAAIASRIGLISRALPRIRLQGNTTKPTTKKQPHVCSHACARKTVRTRPASRHAHTHTQATHKHTRTHTSARTHALSHTLGRRGRCCCVYNTANRTTTSPTYRTFYGYSIVSEWRRRRRRRPDSHWQQCARTRFLDPRGVRIFAVRACVTTWSRQSVCVCARASL